MKKNALFTIVLALMVLARFFIHRLYPNISSIYYDYKSISYSRVIFMTTLYLSALWIIFYNHSKSIRSKCNAYQRMFIFMIFIYIKLSLVTYIIRFDLLLNYLENHSDFAVFFISLFVSFVFNLYEDVYYENEKEVKKE